MKKIIDVSNQIGDVEIVLHEPDIDVKIVGVFELKHKEQKTLNLRVIHTAPRITTEVDLCGVVWDDAQLNLSGTLVIEHKANKTNAQLHEKILLMSPNAKATAIPNLEIKTDDVKCLHTASISSIDEHQLFYAMSRGIEKHAAQKLIADGFLEKMNYY